MPKETINDESAMYDITVGWAPGSHVQVGVCTADGRAIVDALVTQPSDEVRKALDVLLGNGELAAFTGLWGTLSREHCNRLIRILRRARDQAYGRDE